MGFKFIKRDLDYTERCKLLQEKREKEALEKKAFVSPGVWTNDIGPSKEYLDSENIPKDIVDSILLSIDDLYSLYRTPEPEETEFQTQHRMGINSLVLELLKEIENANKR